MKGFQFKEHVTPGKPSRCVSPPKEGDSVLDDDLSTSCGSDIGMMLNQLKHSTIDLSNCLQELSTCSKSPALRTCKELLISMWFVLGTGACLPVFQKTTRMMSCWA